MVFNTHFSQTLFAAKVYSSSTIGLHFELIATITSLEALHFHDYQCLNHCIDFLRQLSLHTAYNEQYRCSSLRKD